MINYFKSVTSSSNVLGSIGIQDYLNKIKQGDENLNNIKLARDYYFDDAIKYVNIKRNLLPCYTLNFTFNKFRRNTNLIDSTGYIYIDIDGTTDIDFTNPLIYATWISLSGYGRGALVRVENLTNENYKSNYDLISNELGIKSDNGARKITQLNVLSYDPDIHINNDSKVWLAKELTIDKIEKTQYSNNIKINPIIANVMGPFNEESIRYDNLDELIENVEFNGDVIHDYRTKVKYSKVKIPFHGIPEFNRNRMLSSITYQKRALNPRIEKSHLFRYINKINRDKCYEPLPVSEINSIVDCIMNIDNIVPTQNAERRFVFNSDYALTIKEKRQEVMKVINSDRRKKSKMKIENTILEWDYKSDGKITQKGIANKIPMNIKTVKNYYPLFKSDIQTLNNKYYNK